MLTMETQVPVRRPLTQTETLAALLEATGDLETAEALHNALPAWLLKASSTVLAALDTDARALLAYQQKVEGLLQKLQPLDTFCASQLSSALTKKWSVVFDVNHDALVLPGFDCGCEGAQTSIEGVVKIPSIRRSLLQAAMQNFTRAETEPDGFPAESTLDIASTPKGLAGLTPAAFASLCRELDLGRRYQEHIDQVFKLSATDDGLANDLKWLKIMKLRVDAHLAFLKEHISEAAYETLLTLNTRSGTDSEPGVQNISHGGESLVIQGMELFGTCVWGVVVFSKRSVDTYPTEWCVVYMPNEPGRPLYEYKTFAEFKLYLGLKLKVSSYKDYFAHGIDEDQKLAFFKSAAQASNLDSFKALPIDVPLSRFMIQSALGKMQIDAREIAVPTADVDEAVRKKRLENLLELGLTVANIGAFFVPVLGQLMLGVSVGMLLAEVYDGVQDWQHGDKQEALSHLLSVAENLALMGAFAVGGRVASSVIQKTVREHPAFFSQFESMSNGSGQARLWRSDLKPYQRPLSTLKGRAADEQGVYLVDGQPHIRIDDSAYRIHYDPTLKQWRVAHPARVDGFSPPLEYNGERGWRLAFEQPHQWRDGSYGLKRADSRLAALEDGRLETLRRVTGTSVPDLHHLNEESQVLSARLKDSIERFRLEQRLSDCIAALENGDPRNALHAPEHLHALPTLSGWPAGRYIRVLGQDQKINAVYPKTARTADEELAVDVAETQVAEGALFKKVVAGLYQAEVDTLLGGKISSGTEEDALARKLASALKQDRLPLFNRLYELHDVSPAPDVAIVRKAFAQLPVTLAQELIDQASSVERLRLRATQRVPMGLAQKAREGWAGVQLDRAISGFYLPEIASDESEELAMALLEHLRGWDSTLLLEVREGTVTGPVLRSIGPPGSALKRTLVKSSAGYQAFDSDAKSLASATKGPDALYEAIVQAIPSGQRTAMGLGDQLPAQARRLRGELLARATEERAASARVLAGKPWADTATPDACFQADPALPSSTHARALVRKVKKLYPLMTDQQINTLLDGLGTDHLTRATAVKQRKAQLSTLRGLLKTWRSDDASLRQLPGDLREYQHSRRQVADAIENSWRRLAVLRNERGNSVPGLSLDGMRVGKLPTLPADIDFSHVQRLSLKGMAQGDDVVQFLASFKGIESLELDGNQITALPEVLAQMPKLIHLSLADNRLRLSETSLAKLAALRSLESLNLSKNNLGATPDVSRMFDLRLLALRDTRATELPQGLIRLPNLNFVDLRDNHIKTLPDWLFEVPTRFAKCINLRTNTLDDASRVKLETYRDNTGVGMGYFDDDIARLNEQSAKALWLPEETRVTFTRRGEIWNAFKDDPQSESLFQLLAELGNTADNEYVREDMTGRVWSVLEAAYNDAALRDVVLNQAANPINCTDTAAMNFSNLEVAVEADKVRRLSSGTVTSAQSLLQLGRVLFRLEQVNAIALEHQATHPAVDPLEANLAYRTGLAEALELPGQPKYMRFSSLGDVSAADIATAKTRIVAAELSPALRTSLARQYFWSDYLKQHSPKAFETMNAPFQTRLSTLFDKAATLKDPDYLAQVEAINKERELAESTLLDRLTEEAIKRVDLGLCAIAEV